MEGTLTRRRRERVGWLLSLRVALGVSRIRLEALVGAKPRGVRNRPCAARNPVRTLSKLTVSWLTIAVTEGERVGFT
eukprot:1622821-Pleurochrysis_carterae.AAC.1